MLVAHLMHTVGTVRANRKGMPPQLRTTAQPCPGQVQAFRLGQYFPSLCVKGTVCSKVMLTKGYAYV